MQSKDNGWQSSASAWIADMGDLGDYGRRHVLDRPMLERVGRQRFQRALDVGCGEGRFCRLLQAAGLATVGVEPVTALRETALARDPAGEYIDAMAESLPFEDESFDLVVSYLTLIDIDGIEPAIAEMARVLKKNGSLLIANLNSFNTAGRWQQRDDGARDFIIDDYLAERSAWVAWRGLRIRNWHRPFSVYMKLLLAAELTLIHFDEPAPSGGEPSKAESYCRSPYFHVMEWQKRRDSETP